MDGKIENFLFIGCNPVMTVSASEKSSPDRSFPDSGSSKFSPGEPVDEGLVGVPDPASVVATVRSCCSTVHNDPGRSKSSGHVRPGRNDP